MQADSGITAVAHAIQLAVAPVFLLSGVAALLVVLTNRLARVIDRSRVLSPHSSSHSPDAPEHAELQTLARRAKLISRAIAWCTISALLVCAVIATLFGGAFARFDASVPVALLFVAAMVALFGGLLAFLREIFLATANLRIDPH
jgi:hypothetical protein